MPEIKDNVVKAPFDESLFQNILKQRAEPEWIKKLRQNSFERFQSLPWPTTRDEEWRRTDISHINMSDYVLPESSLPDSKTEVINAPDDLAGHMRFTGIAVSTSEIRRDIYEKGVIFTSLANGLCSLVALTTLTILTIFRHYACILSVMVKTCNLI